MRARRRDHANEKIATTHSDAPVPVPVRGVLPIEQPPSDELEPPDDEASAVTTAASPVEPCGGALASATAPFASGGSDDAPS